LEGESPTALTQQSKHTKIIVSRVSTSFACWVSSTFILPGSGGVNLRSRPSGATPRQSTGQIVECASLSFFSLPESIYFVPESWWERRNAMGKTSAQKSQCNLTLFAKKAASSINLIRFRMDSGEWSTITMREECCWLKVVNIDGRVC